VSVYSYFVILNYDNSWPGRLLQVLQRKVLLYMQCILVQNIGIFLHKELHIESTKC